LTIHKTPEQLWQELHQQVTRESYEHGESDCEHGIEPQRKDVNYMAGYNSQILKQGDKDE